jgi:hypothetical protein
MRLEDGFGGMRDRFDLIVPPMQPYLKACLLPSVIRRGLNSSLDFHFINRFILSIKKYRGFKPPLVFDYVYCPPVSLVGGSPVGGSG